MDNTAARLNKKNIPDNIFGLNFSLKQAITMRQYGNSMLTPGVRVWLGFALVIIFSMSLIEAVVWAFVSQYFVAESIRWLTVVLAPLFFVGIFVIIWVVDVSFITSERPIHVKSAGKSNSLPPGEAVDDAGDTTAESGNLRLSGHFQIGENLRWWFGVSIRLLIVLISIAITAPFLAQTIRSDEIADKYQAILDKVRKDKEAELVELLDTDITRLRKRREELTKEQDHLRAERDAAIQDSAAAIEDAQKQSEDHYQEYLAEIEGKGLRVAGRGPRARAAMKARDETQAYWRRLVDEQRRKSEQFEKRLSKLTAKLERIDAERLKKENQRIKAQEIFKPLDFATFAKKYDLEVPSDTVGTRVRLLANLRAEDVAAFDPKNKYERLAFHFTSVEGLSQALLGILFLAMLALKAFEPKAVKLYFNEELQYQWNRYLKGRFDQVPGFVRSTESNRYNHFDFAYAYLSFKATPDLFWHQHEKSLSAKMRFDEMARNGSDREQRYQEEIVRNRLESDRKRRAMVRETEVEEEREHIQKEWRLKSEELDYRKEKEKENIDNEYKAREQQYEAETAEKIKEAEEARHINIDALRQKREEEKEALRIENNKRRIDSEGLKRDQELREQTHEKSLQIQNQKLETLKEHQKLMEERRRVQEEQRKGEEIKNDHTRRENDHNFKEKNRKHKNSILKEKLSLYTNKREEAQEEISGIDADIKKREGILRKISHELDETRNQIRKETEDQKKAASFADSSWKRYKKLMHTSPDDDEDLLKEHFEAFERHRNRASELKSLLDKSTDRLFQLEKEHEEIAQEQAELTRKRKRISTKRDEYETEIELAEKEMYQSD
ncbi:MAG: hypothetical protein BECKG1743D_GA0114223_102034 [Candidatus Kentron sp. G]|nr:MAG: hypothetical protein BECKG1743E_GA0114224_101694 [Candidatus Kentron sp. G]VFN00526.1 MAG: hypothetical protein BECKG1743D_GA0114223_102034 [Candidatus Kentron sp. G]